MPNPVPIPTGLFTTSDAETTRAEQLVAAITQIIQYGTTGATTNTPASTVPVGPSNQLQPLVLDTSAKQLYLRQLAVALASTLVDFANATRVGVTRLSSDPTNPALPTALNADAVSVVPGANLVPQARGDGTIDPAWIGIGSGADTAVIGTFSGICASSAAVGDLVYVSGSGKNVAKADITNFSKLPVVGCITSKPTSTTCVVQCHGLVSGIYGGLTPGKAYVVSSSGRPTATLPVPSSGQTLFIQPVGMAIDVNVLLLQPINNITLVRG